ncbi:hypothetical protein [Chitinophaga arvensicola]|uniref:Uncharacterized protein n=1 Tax=Chitinophaga arvensicola TaxID=29529 RepID=A0A1I0SAH2_9BACT|nr:hypothetical protein [Chitinophaga arvensicola]SEW53509.1 hypothetical protein SAMN04488122_5520 [Chitinophaga arvensicola]
MSTEQVCPWCGSTDVIRTIPEKDPFHVMVVCQHCQKVINDPAPLGKQKNASTQRAIEEKTVQLAMHGGKIVAIKYYLTEMNKLPGNNIGLREAKDAVENLIFSRGLTSAIKQPSKNGCVIVLIVLVLVIASIVYFYTHR